MKIIIETGSGSHTTSFANLKAFFHGGRRDGNQLYMAKEYIKSTQWISDILNEKWAITEYDLPEGTEFVVKGKGRCRGNYEVHRLYRLDPSVDVVEVSLDVGLRECLLKGRLVLVKDYIADRPKIDLEEGF